MLRSDAREQRLISSNTDCKNMNLITIDVVCEVEKELLKSPYDVTSLVFLLYDVPDTALQRLLVYQQVSKDIYSTNQNLLHEWIQVAKSKPNWKHEFLEALLICQLYGIVKKLGFNIQSLKRQYQPDNIHHYMYVNPTRKTLYKLCENISLDNLSTLKKTLFHSYRINTTECDSCELVFLKLMSEKIITLNDFPFEKKPHECIEFNFLKLIKLIQKLPGLERFANELNIIQGNSSGEHIEPPAAASFLYSDPTSDVSVRMPESNDKQNYEEDFSAIYDMLSDLNIDEIHMKSDSKKLKKDMYPIKDPKRIGVCLIINQEDFYLCDQSIEDQSLRASLSNRKGSSLDKIALEKTMSAVNFEVISKDNLNHLEMKDFIKNTVKEKVNASTSIFMLCIMSHGVRDHVFAADSVKVKVEDIRNLLDDAPNLQNIPKVLILQACRVDDIPQTTLVADSPSSNKFSLRKLDFLVYSATSPEYEAYRDEKAGSIFIQLLCLVIQKKGKQDHFNDICTKANNIITSYCTKTKCLQVPSIEHSLIKKLYLHIPE